MRPCISSCNSASAEYSLNRKSGLSSCFNNYHLNSREQKVVSGLHYEPFPIRFKSYDGHALKVVAPANAKSLATLVLPGVVIAKLFQKGAVQVVVEF